jgi:hypothetical protein
MVFHDAPDFGQGAGVCFPEPLFSLESFLP